MDGFTRYLEGLVGSWHGLAAADPDAVVVRSRAYIAMRSRHTVLNNSVLLWAGGLHRVCDFYGDAATFAVWTGLADEASAAVQAAGFRRDVTTRPMVCDLNAVAVSPAERTAVERDVDPARVCALNGVPSAVLRSVPDLRCYATPGDESGLAVQDVNGDVVMSFVATRPSARGQGLATGVVVAALADARERGAGGAVLQATPQAEGLYRRLGFVAVGSWQEWTIDAPSPEPA